MSNESDQSSKKPLTLGRGTLGLKRPMETDTVRQSFSHGRSKTVAVEVKKTRVGPAPGAPPTTTTPTRPNPPPVQMNEPPMRVPPPPPQPPRKPAVLRELTAEERSQREKALALAKIAAEEDRKRAVEEAKRREEEDARRRVEEEARRKIEEEEARIREAEAAVRAAEEALKPKPEVEIEKGPLPGHSVDTRVERVAPAMRVAVSAELAAKVGVKAVDDEDEDRPRRAVAAKGAPQQPKRPTAAPRGEPRRRTGKLSVTQALDEPEQDRTRSLASMRRARERERLRQAQRGVEKVIREVIVPDAITVQELASRMAERGGDVIKSLMRQGVMATINHVLDADTAELIVTEFGHTPKRQSESDVEIGLSGPVDEAETLEPRAPVVTIMGHVDHGKTSLLDSLRKTDVAAREAGGITQHIGAYRVRLPTGETITFIDTPGHEAFTEMRARGATVTDIVVLVVAADDGVMPQTIEAIKHAKAAGVPIIVAINKCDKPDAKPERVKTELLSHEIVVEDMGGDVQAVEVSARTGNGLTALKDAILLQAEVLELRANPNRSAEGRVIEAQLDRGRGAVATVLVQRGTLRTGDIFVAGSEWGRVRALVDDRNQQIKAAGPGVPVEVLGLQGVPVAGDDFIVVENEAKARDVTDFRQRKRRDGEMKGTNRSTVAEMIGRIQAGEAKELPIVVKSDVHGSLEAILASINKMATDEVTPRILHSGVGAISESDITLAKASSALIIAFNVRANAQARDMAKRDGIDIRYYSIIYNVVDDVKAALSGLLSPEQREVFLGYAEIRQVFDVTKVGKVAGCRVTEGSVKRGAKVRLLRDNVVIHEGTLKTLRRFKDEVREVQNGFECGMAFENYHDIREGDVIECFEIIEQARTL